MKASSISRRDFAKGLLYAPLLAPGVARAAQPAFGGAHEDPYWWQKSPPKPAFKPQGIPRSKVLKVYSGRTRPDFSPVYMLWEQLSGMKVDLTVISHLEIMSRIVAERNDPRADVMITNTMDEPELVRESGVFDAYKAPVAQQYPDWLRAPDFGWVAFSAWPRSAMINLPVMGSDQGKWPARLEDLAAPEYRGKVILASIQESIVTAYFAALRVARGDEWTGRIINRIFDNGARIYKAHPEVRDALVREGFGVALVNSPNNTSHFFEGNAVDEAWLDQEEGGLGTLVEAHTAAVLHGGRQPEAARAFIDFILSPRVQGLLARLYGEVPVNPSATAGWVRPLSAIRRIRATREQTTARFKDTRGFLAARGFDMFDTNDPLVSTGRAGRRRDREVPGMAIRP